MTDIPEFKIAHLDLRPDDIIVLKATGVLSPETRARMEASVQPAFPRHKILVLDAQTSLEVISPRIADALAAPAPDPFAGPPGTKAWSVVNLGQLADALAHMPPDKPVRFDHLGLTPTGFASYRGYYDQVALGFDDRGCGMTVADLLAACRAAIGQTFQGYKGGDYTMTGDTPVWVANTGNVTDVQITGVRFAPDDWAVQLVTAKAD